MWKAVIQAGDSRLPVKLYAAVEDRNLHFHLLHDQDMTRIKQRMARPDTGETVAYDRIRRGVQVDSDTIVLLSEEDLQALEPEPSRQIEVEAFVPPTAMNPAWYKRPYYLGPDADHETYFAMAEALADADRVGIVHWVMRGKRYLGALAEQDGYLTLMTLRHQEEMIDVEDLKPPEGRDLPAKERQLARQLIEALKDDFEPAAYQDSYREQVQELIAAKARGETLEIDKVELPAETDSLSDSLAASIKAAKR